ncbi:MAG: type II secretion system protein GspE, partial [Pseudomonadales bacterium]
MRLLPFSFAKRFGVLVLDGRLSEGAAEVIVRGEPKLATLAELQRFVEIPLALRSVPDQEFEQLLATTYARDSSAARQMVEDMGDELDLMRRAESVPETEDLLEQEDDAPIIRLINALLAESIKEKSSDIHIETFERELVVRFR